MELCDNFTLKYFVKSNSFNFNSSSAFYIFD